jgi:hypothetical protein
MTATGVAAAAAMVSATVRLRPGTTPGIGG